MVNSITGFLNSFALQKLKREKVAQEIRQESIRKRLFKLATPIFIETLLIMLLGAIDVVMLSRYSDASVAAVGVVNQIIMLTFLVFEVINIGTSVLCSQYIGAKMEKRVVQVVGVSLVVNLLVGGGISAFLFFMSRGILEVMGLGPELMADGTGYMRIVGVFAFFQAISLTLSASLRSANMAVYPMAVTVAVNILNIIGNYALIFGKLGFPELGVEGAAISTAVSRGVAMVVLFIVLFRKHIPRFPRAYFSPFPFVELKNLLKVGIPSAGEQLSYSSSQVVITYFINMLGTEALAARAYCVNVIMFSYLFCIAIAQGGAICIGHLIGQQKPYAAFVLGKYVAKRAVLITVSISCVLALFGSDILGLLTTNAEIIRIGATLFVIDIVLELGRPVNIFATTALRAAGDVNYPFYVGLVVMWSVAVGCSYLFGVHWGWGLAGMWAAFALDENIRGVIFVRRWYGMKWIQKGFVGR
jgi:putative MATE family efflux protein